MAGPEFNAGDPAPAAPAAADEKKLKPWKHSISVSIRSSSGRVIPPSFQGLTRAFYGDPGGDSSELVVAFLARLMKYLSSQSAYSTVALEIPKYADKDVKLMNKGQEVRLFDKGKPLTMVSETPQLVCAPAPSSDAAFLI